MSVLKLKMFVHTSTNVPFVRDFNLKIVKYIYSLFHCFSNKANTTTFQQFHLNLSEDIVEQILSMKNQQPFHIFEN